MAILINLKRIGSVAGLYQIDGTCIDICRQHTNLQICCYWFRDSSSNVQICIIAATDSI